MPPTWSTASKVFVAWSWKYRMGTQYEDLSWVTLHVVQLPAMRSS